MSRYIDVDKFIEDQRKFYCQDCDMRKSTSTGEIVYDIDSAACGSCRLNDALNALEDTPTADVEKVRHGEWEQRQGINVCTMCGRREYIRPNYCPDCGAKMDENK